MKSALPFALAALVLAACATPGGRNGPYAPPIGSQYERQVIGALGETNVSDAQRQAVLSAYDAMAPQLKQNDLDEARVQRDWEALNPRDANYVTQVDALSQRAAALTASRLKALAQFNQAVGTTLDAAQWAQWMRMMRDQRAAFENGRRLDPTFRPDER